MTTYTIKPPERGPYLPKISRSNPISYDSSNRYSAPSWRVVGTRDGARNKYAPEVGSKAKLVKVIQKKAPSRRDRWRAEVAERKTNKRN
jgi:hypothetical protein